MRARFAPALALVLLGATNPCATTPLEDQRTGLVGSRPQNAERVLCNAAFPEERPAICPATYIPVCVDLGTSAGTVWKTFANDCTACLVPGVDDFAPGACPPPVASSPSQGGPVAAVKRPPGDWIDCSARYPERPQACTREYRPVCAVRDTGVRCVKPPCLASAEWKTYGNGCDACSDAAVSGYADGACPEEP